MRLFFQPDSTTYSRPTDWSPDARIVTIRTVKHIMRHWLFPAIHPKATVFFLHGNAQNISAHARSVAWLAKQGVNVFLFEYPGYGTNRGLHVTLNGIMRDIRQSLRAIDSIPATRALPLAILGQSLGASLAIDVAAQSNLNWKFCAVIADSPFADYRMMARDALSHSLLLKPLSNPLSWMIDNTFSPLQHVAQVRAPLLFIHGRNDPIVPFYHSELLFARATTHKALWAHNGGHIEFLHHAKGRHMLLAWLNANCTKKRAGRDGPHTSTSRRDDVQLP